MSSLKFNFEFWRNVINNMDSTSLVSGNTLVHITLEAAFVSLCVCGGEGIVKVWEACLGGQYDDSACQEGQQTATSS